MFRAARYRRAFVGCALSLFAAGLSCDGRGPELGEESAAVLSIPPMSQYVIPGVTYVTIGANSHVTGGHVGSGITSFGTSGLDVGSTSHVSQGGYGLYSEKVTIRDHAAVGTIFDINFMSSIHPTSTHEGLLPLDSSWDGNPHFTYPSLNIPAYAEAALDVPAGTTRTICPPSLSYFPSITVHDGATLTLSGGKYYTRGITLGTNARLNATGSVDIVVNGGTLSTGSGAVLGPVAGLGLTAKNFQIDAAQVTLGPSNHVTAIVLADGLSAGDSLTATGVLFGAQTAISTNATVAWQDGVNSGVTFPSVCTDCSDAAPAYLDDNNPCTFDSCDTVHGIRHLPAPAGYGCSDGIICNGAETCDPYGHCVNPGPAPAGTPCPDANVCNGTERCDGANNCRPGAVPQIGDGNPCGTGACDPTHATPVAGDFNGDGKADIALFTDMGNSESAIWIFYSSGGGFVPGLAWRSGAGNWDWSKSSVMAGDFDGDGKTDLAVAYDHGNSDTEIFYFYASATGVTTPTSRWRSGAGGWSFAASQFAAGKYNADFHGEIAILYNNTAAVQTELYVLPPTGAPVKVWSASSKSIVWANARIAAAHLHSTAVDSIAFAYDVPGNPFIASFVPHTNSGTADVTIEVQGGAIVFADTILTSGDFTGDGYSDLAFFSLADLGQPERLIVFSSGAYATWNAQLGDLAWSGSKLAAGDFDGDGKSDLFLLGGGAHQVLVFPSGGDHFPVPLTWVEPGPGQQPAPKGPPLDDGNDCTIEQRCDFYTGPVRTTAPAGAPCGDGNLCHTPGTCSGTTCAGGGAPVATDDGNPCTADACDPATGVSHAPLDGVGCSDGNHCKGPESCVAGVCAGSPLSIDDGNSCTTDACDPAVGVTHQVAADGTSCSGGACRTNGACAGGACLNSGPLPIDDGNPCTADACDPTTGTVTHTSLADFTRCSFVGGDLCWGGGLCYTGFCMPFPPPVDDGNPCTADTCDPPTGNIAHTPMPAGTACSGISCGVGRPLCDAAASCDCDQVLPPDAAAAAPALDRSVPSRVFDEVQFLFSGADPIQPLPSPSALDERRIAVLRGTVLDRDQAPLPWVQVSIVGHPEFGATVSRANGAFDLAVNGGGPLTVQFALAGMLTVQRTVSVPWNDYLVVPTVVMSARDATPIPVTLGATTAQAVRASLSSDGDGARQLTMVVPAGLGVSVSGQSVASGTFTARATEYTSGATGAQAMPGSLPPSSAYTYAVELSFDEADAAGVTRVDFSQAIPIYLENFLHFPVGETVPAGYYDRGRGAWEPAPSGRVVGVVAVVNGLATLDFDGDGVADDPATYGVSDDERQQVAALYQPGQSLWRVALTHFTPWDFNWGFGPPNDAVPWSLTPDDSPPIDDSCHDSGSIIECENQILGERVPLARLPYSLNYRSDREYGRAIARRLHIPLSPSSVPASLTRIDLEVTVAGQDFVHSFSAAANQSYDFDWDGRDAYGRLVQGAQPVTVRVGYVYAGAAYKSTTTFGGPGGLGTIVAGSRTRREISLERTWTGTLGGWDATAVGLGGWTLSVHHAYDPIAGVLYFGDGERRTERALGAVVSTAAGDGIDAASMPDGAPATSGSLKPLALATGPDGSLYVLDGITASVRRVLPDGTVRTIAGGGSMPPTPYMPASFVQFTFSLNSGIAVGPDGSVYLTYQNQVFRISPDGILYPFAGGDTNGYTGDGGPAQSAQLYLPSGLAVAADGTVYISDTYNNRIRKVGVDGIITTVVGGGSGNTVGDGGPATQTALSFPRGLAVGPDGTLYFPDRHRIRKVTQDGIVWTLAGDGNANSSGDGGPAALAEVAWPSQIVLGPDGSLYFDDNFKRVRRIDGSGVITAFAGNGTSQFTGEGSQALTTGLSLIEGLGLGPDGTFYVADENQVAVRSVHGAAPGIGSSDITLASPDGRELYHFDWHGRHLDTSDALTGARRYTFGYDAAGALASVTDGANNLTTIARAGDTITISGPDGQVTTLGLDGAGHLDRIQDPAGDTIELTSDAGGLLDGLTDARGGVHGFSWDPLGRLHVDSDPAGGSKTLTRSGDDNDYFVTIATALGRTRAHEVKALAGGAQRRTITATSGEVTTQTINADDSVTTAFADGTNTTDSFAPDPRSGLQAPVPALSTVTTPSGLTRTVTGARTAVRPDPAHPLTISRQTDTVAVNGKPTTRVYDAASNTFTTTSAAGRQVVTAVDSLDLPTAVSVTGLTPVQLAYDTRGRLSTIAQGSRATIVSYDVQGNLQSVTDPASRVTSYGYDGAGRVISETLPDSSLVAFGYDANGNVVSVTPPSRPAHGVTYTPMDAVQSYSPPDVGLGSTAIQYGYNNDHQLTSITRPDGQTIAYGYNAASGRLDSMTQPRGTTSYAYETGTGRLHAITAPDGGMLTYGYDGSLVTSTTWSGAVAGTVSRTFNNDLRVASETVGTSPAISFSYDDDGLLLAAGALSLVPSPSNQLLGTTTIANVSDSRSYDGFGALHQYGATFNGVAAFYSVTYDRDQLGRVTTKTEAIAGLPRVTGYAYDAAGHLQEVTVNGTLSAHYDYDANGNRAQAIIGGTTTVPSYNAQDQLTQYGATSYTYGSGGERATKTDATGTTHYTYDLLGNLTAVVLPDGTSIHYVIDGHNRRIGKQVGGVLVQGFLYDGQLRPVAELDGNGALVSQFVYATRANVPDYLIRGGTTWRIITDQLGSVRMVVNAATGAIQQQIDYDEFGVVLNDTSSGFQPFGFAGGLYDRDTHLVRFGARDYDAVTGRWLSKDPLGFAAGDSNLYSYSLADPVNGIDPTGLLEVSISVSISLFVAGQLGFTISSDGVQINLGLGVSNVGPNASASFSQIETHNPPQTGWSKQISASCPLGGLTGNEPAGSDRTTNGGITFSVLPNLSDMRVWSSPPIPWINIGPPDNYHGP